MPILRWIGWAVIGMVFVFICGVLTSAPLMAVIQNNMFTQFTVLSGAEAQQAIQRQFNINFPSGVSDFHRASRGDRAYWIRFTLTPEQLSGLFRGSPYVTCMFPLQESYRPGFQFRQLLTAEQRLRMPWWNTDEVQSFIGGECTGEDFKIFRMFADRSGSQMVFYLEVVRL